MIRREHSGKNCSESGMRTWKDRFLVRLNSRTVLPAKNADRWNSDREDGKRNHPAHGSCNGHCV
jgi:hypothetical protein